MAEETLRPLSDVPAINRFLSYCRVRTIPGKTVMIHAGDLPDVLYYIVDGSVEVMIEDEDGNEMVLAYLNKGQFFGEMGLFYEQPQRSAWVRTRSESEIAEKVRELGRRYPELAIHEYEAGHGFDCDHRSDFDSTASAKVRASRAASWSIR